MQASDCRGVAAEFAKAYRPIQDSPEDQLNGTILQLISKLNQELESGYPCSDSANDAFDNIDITDESRLPPPMPYFDRRIYAASPAPSLIHGVLSRARSSSPCRRSPHEPRGRVLCHGGAMAQSMPNLHSSRSMYNRCIGYSMLSSASELGDKQGEQANRARVAEFDALLEGL